MEWDGVVCHRIGASIAIEIPERSRPESGLNVVLVYDVKKGI